MFLTSFVLAALCRYWDAWKRHYFYGRSQGPLNSKELKIKVSEIWIEYQSSALVARGRWREIKEAKTRTHRGG